MVDESISLIAAIVPPVARSVTHDVLVNAVAHTDYSLTGMRVREAIYDDRLEVENPGMLPFGMTLDDFKAGVSRIRNRVIVRVLRELRLNERQRWILDQLRHGQALKADAIAAHFGVAEKTAKRDLAALKAHALIQLVGRPKTGSYRLAGQG